MKSIPLRFARNVGVLTEDEQRQLLLSKVAVVGLGCTGCAVVEFLTRAGIGGLTLVDGDRFEESNINRQLYAKSSTLGQFKVDAARDAVLDINPDAEVVVKPHYLQSEDDGEMFHNVDLIINGVDDPYGMVIIHRVAKVLSKPSVFLLSGVVPFQGVCCVIPPNGLVDYETLMGLPTRGRALENPEEIKQELFEKITKARVHSSLHRGAISGNWVDDRLRKGGGVPSFGVTSNITSLVAAGEAIKVLIKRPGLEPVIAPDLIYYDGATCQMYTKHAKADKLWFQGDF